LSFGHLPVTEAKEGIRRLAAGLSKLTT
jgi:hypothetical protein